MERPKHHKLIKVQVVNEPENTLENHYFTTEEWEALASLVDKTRITAIKRIFTLPKDK